MKILNVLAIVWIFCPLNAIAASITIGGTSPITSDQQLTSFILNFDGQDYKWNANTPVLSGTALQSWLNARIDHYQFSTLHTQYRGLPEKVRSGDYRLAG